MEGGARAARPASLRAHLARRLRPSRHWRVQAALTATALLYLADLVNDCQQWRQLQLHGLLLHPSCTATGGGDGGDLDSDQRQQIPDSPNAPSPLPCSRRLLLFRISGWAVSYLLVSLLYSVVQMAAVVDWRRRPLWGLLTALRLQVLPELCWLLWRPTYQTLHPQFTLPLVPLLDAVFKSLPQLLFQAALALSYPQLPLRLHSLLLALLAIAYALAVYELGDFKLRQMIRPVSLLSPDFALLMAFRLAEAAARVSLAALVVTASPVHSSGAASLAVVLMLDLGGLAVLVARRARRLSPARLAGALGVLVFIFWDVRLLPGPPGQPKSPARAPVRSLVHPLKYYAWRAGLTAACLLAIRTRLSGAAPHAQFHVVVCILATLYMLLLLPFVYRRQWRTHLMAKALSTPMVSPSAHRAHSSALRTAASSARHSTHTQPAKRRPQPPPRPRLGLPRTLATPASVARAANARHHVGGTLATQERPRAPLVLSPNSTVRRRLHGPLLSQLNAELHKQPILARRKLF